MAPKPVSPEIIAEMWLLPTAKGGRSGPILQGEYRGVLGVSGEHFSVRFLVPLQGDIAPGQSSTFGIQFLVPEAALPFFPVGAEFTVWEGGIIGNGKVLKVLRDA
jgi:hypothetical protein